MGQFTLSREDSRKENQTAGICGCSSSKIHGTSTAELTQSQVDSFEYPHVGEI